MLCFLVNAIVLSLFLLSVLGYVPPAWSYFVPVIALAAFLYDVWDKTKPRHR